MTLASKLQFVRDQLRIYAELQRPAANEVLWIMLKLSCGKLEAESLMAAARKPMAVR